MAFAKHETPQHPPSLIALDESDQIIDELVITGQSLLAAYNTLAKAWNDPEHADSDAIAEAHTLVELAVETLSQFVFDQAEMASLVQAEVDDAATDDRLILRVETVPEFVSRASELAS